MKLNEFQELARKTALYPELLSVIYPMIGLCNEAGEALGKLKKVLRGDKTMDDQKKAIIEELGDVLWYLATSAGDLNITLQEVAELNLEKLKNREDKGAIRGDGDNR